MNNTSELKVRITKQIQRSNSLILKNLKALLKYPDDPILLQSLRVFRKIRDEEENILAGIENMEESNEL